MKTIEPGIRAYLEAINEMMEETAKKSAYARLPSGVKLRPEKFVLNYGQNFSTDKLSFVGKRGKLHECYSNAGRAAFDDSTLLYVEGYVTCHGLPIAHAWNVTKKGIIRDPTVRTKINGKKVDRSDEEYFGVAFTTDYLRETILRTKVWGMFGAHNLELLKNPEAAKIIKKFVKPT